MPLLIRSGADSALMRTDEEASRHPQGAGQLDLPRGTAPARDADAVCRAP